LNIINNFKGIRRFSNGTNFTSLLLIDTSLFVGAKDNLFKLDALNIENNNPLVSV
jgi:hypothetical protein